MKFKTIFIRIIVIQIAACQQKDNLEISGSDDDTNVSVYQIVPISDTRD